MQVTVGRIGRPHGVRGELVVGVRTDEPDARFAVGARLDTDPASVGPLTVAAARWQSGELIVRFSGITDRTVASGLTGTWLSVDSRTLDTPADPDEFRDHQLIDLIVRTKAGEVVGVVCDVLHHGQDLLVVLAGGATPQDPPASGGETPLTPPFPGEPAQTAGPRASQVAGRGTTSHEILVPFVKAIVTEVDVAGGTLVIDPPPGLLNPDEAE